MSTLVKTINVNQDITVSIYDDYTEVTIKYVKGTIFKEQKISREKYWYRDYDRVYSDYSHSHPFSAQSLFFLKDGFNAPREALALYKDKNTLKLLDDIVNEITKCFNDYKERGVRIINNVSTNTSSSNTLFCRHCGKKIEADSAFCKYCGNKQ